MPRWLTGAVALAALQMSVAAEDQPTQLRETGRSTCDVPRYECCPKSECKWSDYDRECIETRWPFPDDACTVADIRCLDYDNRDDCCDDDGYKFDLHSTFFYQQE